MADAILEPITPDKTIATNQSEAFSFTGWDISTWLDGNAELTKLAVALFTIVNLLHLQDSMPKTLLEMDSFFSKKLFQKNIHNRTQY